MGESQVRGLFVSSKIVDAHYVVRRLVDLATQKERWQTQSGRNGGGWTGNGIVTSLTQATTSNFTSIGIATDDYGIIDFNVGIQAAPFPTGSTPGMGPGVTTVPEPAFGGVILIGIATTRMRRQSGGHRQPL